VTKKEPTSNTLAQLALDVAGRLAAQFGARIRQLRNQRGLSQTQLGTLLDLSQKYISELERGMKSPSWETLVRIAVGFDVEVWMLLHEAP
jgi:transcriptional regulator with XRE-family HTH domain